MRNVGGGGGGRIGGGGGSIEYKSVIYTAGVSYAKRFFILGCRSSSVKALCTRQPFSMKCIVYTLLSGLQ